MDEYDGRQFVGIDLHRQRSVIVRRSKSLVSSSRRYGSSTTRSRCSCSLSDAGADPEVVLEATYGWVRSEGA